ncbi:TonB-linked outer membrane protein, SusC/RagA family [Parapedobacter composti]|uniref:TonB-linked outer membrane protein, SusC/RagA family n=1 Tax=Parapedobacter composti TaxID=623281 RepID=A0A1I1IZA9_9SPHI|nr:SusC/RagA family TonB-linked outer membrane protein [Parapedobacter composti]SFC39718.1 TonB-linked outer membrane protein, SusC/RagA family [Parapedobacter composti]
MKLACILMFVGIIGVSASGYSQEAKVSVKLSDRPLAELIAEIKKQTSYSFLFDAEEVDVNRKVSVSATNTKVKSVLQSALREQGLELRMSGNHILIVRPKPGSLLGAQQRQVSGTVKDTDGTPVAGATIVVKTTEETTQTDTEGRFVITVSSDQDTLAVSFVGMQPLEVAVGRRTALDITLQVAATEMNEVVITALGIRRQSKSLTYNVQQIDGNAINTVSDANFVNNLNGKIAGATINSASSGVGGSSRVVMRGVKSISGNNNALYVIDGIPMPSLSTDQPADIYSGAGQTGDGISNLNPEDIESISVLSGSAAAALYGSSASNGVILITTKKGKQGQFSINVSNHTQFSAPLILPALQNTYGPSEPGSYYSWGEKLNVPSDYNVRDFFNTGINVTNAVSLSTGNDKNQTYVSAGTVNAGGVLHNNDYNRYNFSVRNTSSFLNDRMTMDLGFMHANVNEQNMTAQGLYFNPLVPIYLFPAGDDFTKVQIYERYDASRNFKTQFWPYGDQGLSMQNPYWIMERDRFQNNKQRYMTNATLQYRLNDWINLSGRLKLDRSNDKFEKKFNASTNTLFASENGYYSLNEAQTQQVYAEFLMNINKTFAQDALYLTANVGTNVEDVQYDQNMYGGKLHGVPNLFTYANVNNSTAESSQSGYHRNKQAVFASMQLGYHDQLFLDLTGRNDWASTLAMSNIKSFFYPSIGISAVLTDLFNFGSDVLPYLKARVSYSEVGNEPNPFLTIPTYSLSSGYPQTQTRMPNTDLRPERTRSWEAGTNATFFRNKLNVDATVYYSSTYNQFFEPTLSSSSGYTSVIVNAGQIDNKGIEIAARYNEDFGALKWNTYLVYSLNRNRIVELLPNWTNPVTGEQISLTEIDMGGTGSYKMVLEEGGSMGDIYVSSLRTDEHGAIYVHPTDQTVVAEPNQFVYAGNSNPKYNFGWGNSLTWKGASLSFLFTGRVGGVVVSNTQAILDAFGASQASADARDAGGVLVNGRPIPAKPYYDVVGGGSSGGVASMYTYSATNIRLGELALGYDLPINHWVNAIKGANVSLIGRNLFFLYNKAPYDPELTANTGTYFQGIDYFMSPSLRSLGFSLKLQF